jgi:hypothetical protein
MQRIRSRVIIIAAGVAVALIVSLLLFVVDRRRASLPDEPQTETVGIGKRIEIFFDAAQKSDVDRYLDCLAEPLRSQVREQIAANPGLLGRSEAKLNGYSIGSGVNNADGDEATVVVEKVYGETIERVRFRLTRIEGQWKIAEMRPLERVAPETPYGTPVFRVR